MLANICILTFEYK